MATIARQQAVERLTKAVHEARPDDLAEIHNELFPEKPIYECEAAADPETLVKKVLAHISNGLEDQEILDLWNVVFPLHRRVRFDEDDGLIHYNEKTERVDQVD